MATFPSIKPPPAPCYKRPHDLVYALADKPPPGAMAVLVFIRHHQNIARLLKGEEPKIGKKKKAPDGAEPAPPQ